MIRTTQLAAAAGWSVSLFECDGGHHGWSAEEEIGERTLVLVRSGFFRRRINGVETLANPLVAYLERPTLVQRVEHPGGGDVCTGIGIPASCIDELICPTVDSHRSLPVDASADLDHRLLLKVLARSSDGHDVMERAMGLAARILGRLRPGNETRPGARDLKVTEYVQEALRHDPHLGLEDLALGLAMPAYQVSRIFRAVTGRTVSQFRLTIRARMALERLDGGETDLASLALDAGFADQSHMTRVLRGHTQLTPGHIRHLLQS